MDEQYEMMRQFYRELAAFNTDLRAMMRELERRHDTIDAIWQDEFRRRYDAERESYKQTMDRYVARGSFAYEQFLEGQLRDLERYLFGR